MSNRLYASRLDLPEHVRRATLPMLQRHLVHTLDLFLQMKQAHWAVRGPQFFQLHELFDRLAEELEDASDELAERMTALGGAPDGRVQTVSETTGLYAYPEGLHRGEDHLKALAGSMAMHAKGLRADIDAAAEVGDADTSDLFTQLSRQADKHLWLIEAHLDD